MSTALPQAKAVYRDLESQGFSEDVCRAGLLHSIYGTELFQGPSIKPYQPAGLWDDLAGACFPHSGPFCYEFRTNRLFAMAKALG